MLFKDISNFNNISNYLPILNGSICSDIIIIFLLNHGIFNSLYLKKWYKKYQLSAVIADVLILVIINPKKDTFFNRLEQYIMLFQLFRCQNFF